MRVMQKIMISLVLIACAMSAQQNQNRQQGDGSSNPTEEAHFTQEQLNDYYLVYKNADVRYLRTVFDAYLKKSPMRPEERDILKKWDAEYYRSKFIVASRDNDPFGGTLITIVFQSRPDKVFIAWVYPEGSKQTLTLRELAQDTHYTDEDIKRMNIRFKKFLEDKVHAM